MQKLTEQNGKNLSFIQRERRLWFRGWEPFLILLPVLIYYIIFHYIPMYGVLIAFKDFRIHQGIMGSEWVGFKWFASFFRTPDFFKLIRNTVMINVIGLFLGFPAPIILAIMLNEVRHSLYKRTIQTISYLPHFVSIVIIAGMMVNFLSPRSGIINILLGRIFGIKPIHFLAKPGYFWWIFTGMNIWKNIGWGSIIYIAAITGIDPAVYEAAIVDGAGRFRRIRHVTLPGIMPTVIILLILNMGRMLSVGAESIILLYNPAIYETADVISTFVYRRGLLGGDYSFAAAVGLFNSVINLLLLFGANRLSRKVIGTSLW
jgi:putative aldouronate transport system permease protein